MANYIYRNCTKVFATSPSFVKHIEKRESVWTGDKSKVIYWPQYAEEFYKPSKTKVLPDLSYGDKFRVVFTGNIGYAQGLDILPKTAALLKKDNVKCEFVIIGDGRYREEFEKEIESKNVKEMFWLLGRKKPEEISDYLALCDVAFISFADNSLLEMTIPSKLQSYMACGKPILTSAGGETRRIIEEAQCGMCCDIRSEEVCAEKIKMFMNVPREHLQNMSHNALAYCNKYFSKTVLHDLMEEYLEG